MIEAQFTREIPLSQEDSYNFIMDTDYYPSLFPDVKAARMRREANGRAQLDLAISAGFFSTAVKMDVTENKPHGVLAKLNSGVIGLKALVMEWRFAPLEWGGTAITGIVSLDLSTFSTQSIARRLLARRLPQVADMFAEKAFRLYRERSEGSDKPSIV
jgi:ribosome-associated toxin RatA of RatAB toxin-antitoxin module